MFAVPGSCSVFLWRMFLMFDGGGLFCFVQGCALSTEYRPECGGTSPGECKPFPVCIGEGDHGLGEWLDRSGVAASSTLVEAGTCRSCEPCGEYDYRAGKLLPAGFLFHFFATVLITRLLCRVFRNLGREL